MLRTGPNITVANGFIEAFSEPAAMPWQIWEILHPSSHIPSGRSSFKPPKVNKKNDEKKSGKEKQKQKPKSRKHKDVPPTSSCMDKMEKRQDWPKE